MIRNKRCFQCIGGLGDVVGQAGELGEQARLILAAEQRRERLLRGERLSELGRVGFNRREDLLAGHVDHGLRLDVDGLAVVIQHDLAARFDLGLGEDLMAGEHRDVLGIEDPRQRIGRRPQVEQAALFGCFLDPCVVVAVAVEEDAAVGLDRGLDEVVQGRFEILCLFEAVGILPERLGNGGIEHNIAAGDGVRRAQHPELELVAGEGEGRGAVAVGGVAGELRQDVDAELHDGLFRARVGLILFDRIEDRRQFIAEEHRHDGGRRFVRAEAVVVAGGRNREAEQILIIIYGLNDRDEEEQELCVLIRRGAGAQQVDAGIRGHRPVVVLARAVDAVERLFMQQTDQTVPRRDLLHDLHGELVVVGGDVGRGVNRGQLVLRRGDLIVLRLGKDAELPQLFVQVCHIFGHAGLDDAEIVVVHLLALGRLRAEERPAAVDEILALFIHRAVDEEVFLLGSDRGADAFDVLIAEQLQDAHRLLVERLHRAEQRRLFVERLAAVGAEGRRDAECFFFEERVGRRVPGSIAARLKRRAQAAGGEARGIRLALDQLLARELHDHAAVRRGGDEAVVLFGSDAGQRLEPVGEMGGAVFDGPVLHRVGHSIGDLVIQARAFVDGLFQRGIYIVRKSRFHDAVVKDLTAEIIRYCVHVDPLLF